MECMRTLNRRRKARKRTKLNMLKTPYIYDPRLYDPMQCVYGYLCVETLSMLSRVSRKLYRDMENYCKITCLRLSLDAEVNTLLNRQPILNQDNAVRNKLQETKYSSRWLFSTWKKFNRVYRMSVRCIWFPHAGDNAYIPIYYDDELQREIVEIKNVCWLHLQHRFSAVRFGSYRAVLRMEINNVAWGRHEEPAKIRVYWEDTDGLHEKRTEIKWDRWPLLLNSLANSKCVSSNGASLSNYDSDTGWFDFCLQDFNLTSTTDVHFEFNDIANDWWKSGMRWDYLELIPLDWDKN